jgi:hypothetical protein
MILLAYFGDLNTSMGMWEPVEVNSERLWPQLSNMPLHIVSRVLQHSESQVDDANRKAMPRKIFRDGGEPERVHFKYGSGGDDIANGPEHDWPFAKIIDARRMEQNQIWLMKGNHELSSLKGQ